MGHSTTVGKNPLDAYFRMYGNDYPIHLRHEGSTILLNTQEIVCLEAMGKECIVHLPKGYKIIASTMAVIIDLLPKSHFFRVHRRFYINFNYIVKYDSQYIYMKSGEKVLVSSRGFTPFKRAYKEYTDQCNPKRTEANKI